MLSANGAQITKAPLLGQGFLSVQKLALLVAVTAAFFWAGLAGAATPESHAGFSRFCPAGPGSQLLGPDGYCMSARFYTLRAVLFSLTNGSGVKHCALAKWYADGSGSNAIPASCTTGHLAITDCYSRREAYAKGTNESASPHYYNGEGAWGDSCYY